MLDYNREYTISEASEITGYAPHVLRYYEKEFNIDIPRKDSNHRYYTYKEIELIQYIKSLKEKGFGNKQINLIINSPEEIISTEEGASINIIDSNRELDSSSIALQISDAFGDIFFERLSEFLYKENRYSEELITDLKKEIITLRNDINSKERDVLLCENAKLKMKVKEQNYENLKLREELEKSKNKNQNIFKRIFKLNK
ncbi:MerR family transcriptional regulator [Wansuia hejianensis]|uniref:MerR family transcriptional regulator n=1 Tax=Wansuia hejianensis TaxID=2763667 RepID=A0A926EZI4_9FIRM|nr:MerR family transcriptional regulator [Wansuia hejianensis]MBC8590541.1 MerR family transcriptional regulator [Wansuia hejianensis]